MNSRLSLETFLCLVYLVIRTSPTGKPNEELNLKTCTFNFFLQLQRSKENDSQNGYSICEKLFLRLCRNS